MPPAPASLTQPARYEIRILEPIHERWLSWFDEFEIMSTETGGTLLTGSVTDQAALHGILAWIHDLHLTLISVNRVETGDSHIAERSAK